MKIAKSGAKYSAIVGIGEKIKQLSDQTGKEYLYLNRGVNAVTHIDLSEVIKKIDFNSEEIQVYPRNNGLLELRQAINREFFGNAGDVNNIYVTHGGMGTIDLVVDTLDVKDVWIPKFYWGAYRNIMTIRNVPHFSYDNFEYLRDNVEKFKDSAVLICDPNNPLGSKYDDISLYELVRFLDENGVVVLFDGPYRRLFYDSEDDMYLKMGDLDNVIIMESFSKSIGLSGQRIGFMHSKNVEFGKEFNIRLLYTTNGVNAFAQVLVYNILVTPEGQKAAADFKRVTVAGIEENISYLRKKGLLAEEFYLDTTPVGIFVIVNKSEEELLKNRIGSVGLPFFTQTEKDEAKKYARICVSVAPQKFMQFFNPLT